MSINNTLFFSDPKSNISGRVKLHNTNVLIHEMTDDNFATSSAAADVDIDISDGTSPTAVDYIFLKYTGDLMSYAVTPTGGVGSAFLRNNVPTTVQNWEGSTVSLEVDGFKHDLYEVPSDVTATSVRMQFVGTGVRIVQLMVLSFVFELEANDGFTQMDFQKVDRLGRVHPNANGGVRSVSPIVVYRRKYEGSYTYQFGYRYADEFMGMADHHRNHAFVQEFSRHPARVWLACFGPDPLSGRYFTEIKPNGEEIQFQILER